MTHQPTPTDEKLKPSALHKLFVYDAETGALFHKAKPRVAAGSKVGSPDTKGRLRTEINGKSYAVHHVCWAMHHGYWPQSQLDHINRKYVLNETSESRQNISA